MLRKLIELIHIDIHKKLTREITERQTNALARRMKTADNLREKPEYIIIRDMALQYLNEYALVYRSKELSYIAF